MENEMEREEVSILRDDKALTNALWDRILTAEEVAMVRRFRETGRKGVALLKCALHVSREQMQEQIELTKEALGVAKVLVVSEGIDISRI